MENLSPPFFFGVHVQQNPTTNRAEVEKCQNQDMLGTLNVNTIASKPSYIKDLSTGNHNHIPLTRFKQKKLQKLPIQTNHPHLSVSHKYV